MSTQNVSFLAAVILYDPPGSFLNLLELLQDQGCNILLVVNKSNDIVQSIHESENIHILFEKENLGIASALNKAIAFYLDGNFDFFLSFDQDSIIPDDYIGSLNSVYNSCKKKYPKLVCLAPRICDRKKDLGRLKYNSLSSQTLSDQVFFEKVKTAIMSGCMYDRDSFACVGLMNELLFIDCVDHEWCERANVKGYVICQSSITYLDHSVGNYVIRWLGQEKTYHKNDIRVYYIIRNSLYLTMQENISVPWKIREILKTLIRLIAYPILSDHPSRTLKFELLALKDALLNQMGKMNYIVH